MTNQEAIRLIRNHPTMCEFPDAYGEPYYKAVDMAISALEKQIPQKPKMPLDAYWVCPTCGSKVEHPFEHCMRCGQAIDWEEG